ncbi:hypothetical protein [Gilvimarinus xylanilyticus]|uniref:Uncharacterized protein n=1 Tax=Gilvimarinus xylanilyticus TaxID=2944139 RepID=A0A9X2HVS4_9GAMM|nr:hypothetical protein [Gilvimarinus xylanilyticus]MCP8898579.1 hypothetical protein [Gilvimarinus xylanilyticus]
MTMFVLLLAGTGAQAGEASDDFNKPLQSQAAQGKTGGKPSLGVSLAASHFVLPDERANELELQLKTPGAQTRLEVRIIMPDGLTLSGPDTFQLAAQDGVARHPLAFNSAASGVYNVTLIVTDMESQSLNRQALGFVVRVGDTEQSRARKTTSKASVTFKARETVY